jgi:Glycosyl transferases group 1
VTRIAVVQQGDPTEETSWSGVPTGIISGLEASDCEVIPIRGEFRGAPRIGRALRMSWAAQSTSRAFAAACSTSANRALRAADPLDGIVMIGSGYTISTETPFVTFEDMTVAQAMRRGDPLYDALSKAGIERWLKRQQGIYEDSRACCVTSHWAGKSVRDDYGIPASKVHVVGVGHNIDVGRVERNWSVPHFLFVGLDWERKRGDAVVVAFAAVRERYPGATLDLVGGHPPVNAEGVTGHGMLPLDSPDGQRRYGELIRRATCFLMPSRYEAFGIAYVDAGASGVPSIGTTVGGAPDAVGDGGRVVDPSDEWALQDAMLELADPETARRLGERAFMHSKLLTWQAVAGRVLRALRAPGVDNERLLPFLEPA